MKTFVTVFLLTFAAPVSLAQSGSGIHKPTTLPLECASDDCPLLKGMPQTAGLRSGFVRLKPGATVGWHTTGTNEETLVILHGKGEAQIEGAPAMAITEKMVAYIPPATRHNVKNTGTDTLEYVYVVAPTSEK